MKESRCKTILLVEDEAVIAMNEKIELEKCGYRVITAFNGLCAVEAGKSDPSIDLVLMDIDLGNGMDGTRSAQLILEARDIPLVFLSSHTELELVNSTEQISSYGYIVKQSGITVVDASIQMAFKLHESRKKLIEGEERFRKAVEQAPIAMAIVGMDGAIEFINRKAVDLFGYSHEDIPNMDRWWVQAYPDEEYRAHAVADWTGRVGKALSEGVEIVGGEYRVSRKDGGITTAFISGAIVSGKVFVLFEDITDRKRAETAIRESEERFSTAFRASPYAFMIADMDSGRILEVNDAFTAVSGYSREEALAASTLDLKLWVDEADRRRFVDALRSDIPVVREETRLRAKGGEEMLVLFSARAIRMNDRSCIVSNIEDITERRGVEDELKKANQDWRSIFDGIPNPVIIIDPEQNVLAGNRIFEEALGLSAAGYQNKKCWELFHGPSVTEPPEGCPFIAMKESRRIETHDMEVRALDGVYSIACTPMLDENGRLERVIHIATDITERVRTKKRLEKQVSEKDILLKEVHHRIKNNIASIEALVSIQLGSTVNTDVASALRDVKGRIAGMRLLYDKLILSGGSGTVPVMAYVEGLVAAIADLFPLKDKVGIVTEIGDFALDSKQLFYLGIIINEIITNAFKYAFAGREGGSLRIDLGRIGNHVRLVVRDNGVGLAAGFELTESKGFGLMLVRMLADQLEGSFAMGSDGGSRSVLEFDI
jgi:PAS domain S-box-containing protein